MDGDKYPKSFLEPKDMFVGCGRVTGNSEVIQNALEILGPIRVQYQFPRVPYNAKRGCQCR
jgi:hypothetical protein